MHAGHDISEHSFDILSHPFKGNISQFLLYYTKTVMLWYKGIKLIYFEI